MFYKAIIQGRLEFGTEKSYSKVHKMYEYRTENYYKNALIFKSEDVFIESERALFIPRHVSQVLEKSFKNTTSLLEYCSQFAVSGSVRAWLINEGKIMHYFEIEPESDKAAVQSFLKGRNLVKQSGKEEEAILALTKAIEKYDRHAQAYERRAKVNFILKKYHDAKRDYGKSIGIDPTIPTSYYGRAKVHVIEDNFQEAIYDLEKATKNSIALQSIYWKARRMKATCHIKLEQYEKAAFDLKFYTMRKFKEDDINFHFKKWGLYNYGICLLEIKEYEDALEAFDKALSYENNSYFKIKDSELIRNRGYAKRLAGKKGYITDLKQAIKLGDKKAQKLLKELA